MYRLLKASKDTYLTDRVIRGVRHERANTGQAGTLDLFKLHGINTSGSNDMVELSRALVKFDLDPLRMLTGSTLIPSHSSFKCYMSLTDVYAGQPTPSNFTLFVAPLSRSWDEGIGFDVVSYNDIDSSNFLTASRSGDTASLWFLSGANRGGLLGSADIDVILSGNLSDGQGVSSLTGSQVFSLGTEDLLIDVTRLVSATVARQLPDEGFRLSFIAAEETDTKTRFVKRFGSRHASDPSVRPKLIVKYDDALQDDQADSRFDMQNTVFLYNYDRNGLANLTSGSAQTPITGANSLVMRLITDSPVILPSGGLYQLTVTASQHQISGYAFPGMYSASFTIPSSTPELTPRLAISQSIEFTQIWGSLPASGSVNGSIGYLTTSRYTISKQERMTSSKTRRDYIVSVLGSHGVFDPTERVRFRVFAQAHDGDDVRVSKLPFKSVSTVFNRAFYSIREAHTGGVIVPFETQSNATRLSTDGEGMYFDLFMADLDADAVYEIDVLVKDADIDRVYHGVGGKFRVKGA